jgi:hypothetical protein
MQSVINHYFKLFAILLFAASVTACSSTGEKKDSAMEVYEVHHDGRINVFYDRDLYLDFVKMGETPYRLTRIGAGPNGETIVFGLTKQDKKMKSEIPVISLFDGKMKAPEDFYGEMRANDRIYVFSNWEDMGPVRQFGNPNYFYTQIGAGPNGETVVYVLNKHTKKHRPDALVEKFQSMNKK